MARYKAGDSIHFWTLLAYQKEQGQWLAKCVCGKEKLVWISHLTSGKSKSCSCVGKSSHGMTGTPTYRSWDHMKQRCLNPNNDRYNDYGGRGIKVCERWLSFDNFLADMGERPDGTTIDRIDTDGDYTPDNCRWATTSAQQSNRLLHKRIGIGSNIRILAETASMPYGRMQGRLYRGWPLKMAITEPFSQGKDLIDPRVRAALKKQRRPKTHLKN